MGAQGKSLGRHWQKPYKAGALLGAEGRAGERKKTGRKMEGAMEDYPCNLLTMGQVTPKLGTLSTYLGLRTSLSMPIFILFYKRLLSALDSV